MIEQIPKRIFKQDAELQIEVVSLLPLTTVRKELIEKPHRTNFYHIFLFEDCQPTHSVDFKHIDIVPYSLLFIDKDRVHQFDQESTYKGKVLIFTDEFFSTNENDTKFYRVAFYLMILPIA